MVLKNYHILTGNIYAMQFNFIVIVLAAFIPLLTGFIWYHPKVMGTAWMRASGVTEEKMKTGNMFLIFGLTLVLGFIISFVMSGIVIHQFHLYSIVQKEPAVNDPNSEAGKWVSDSLARYGKNFRTFKHGAFHGTLIALLLVTPILSICALFERRSFKYIAVHAGYWILTLALIGGVICQWV